MSFPTAIAFEKCPRTYSLCIGRVLLTLFSTDNLKYVLERSNVKIENSVLPIFFISNALNYNSVLHFYFFGFKMAKFTLFRSETS